MAIRGPFGIWPFPLLNFLLELLKNIKAQADVSGQEERQGPRKRIYQLVRDEKGRIVEIVELEA